MLNVVNLENSTAIGKPAGIAERHSTTTVALEFLLAKGVKVGLSNLSA